MVFDELSNPSIVTGAFAAFKIIMEKIWDYYKKSQITSEIKISLEYSFNKSEKSFNDFIDAYMLCVGAVFVGNNMKFLKPTEKSQQLVSNLKNEYFSFISDFKSLLRHLKTHEIFLKEIMGKDWVTMQIYIEAFDANEPDWIVLFGNKKIQEILDLKSDEIFLTELNKEMNQFCEEIKCPKIFNDLKKITNISSKPKFMRCVYRCIVTRLIKVRKR
jgi:hypothetical protein